MDKIDFKKTQKELYNPGRKEFAYVEVPAMQFLMVDGKGDPNTAPWFQQATEALYGVAFPLKFTSKKQLGRDYTVLPLEGLWWQEDMSEFSVERKDDGQWTLMVRQPEQITAEMVQEAIAAAKKKKPELAEALDKMRFETYAEGLSIQIMHIGPYADEAPTIAAMHERLQADGYTFGGHHHEIYLSDPRKADPAKMKTVLRQPVRKA
jgi:hypothetical protein